MCPSVVDPRDYGGICDTEVPVILAYDLVHYESLETKDLGDIARSVRLTESYTAKPCRYRQEFGFTRDDMKCLISSADEYQQLGHNLRFPRKEKYDMSKTEETSNNKQSITNVLKESQNNTADVQIKEESGINCAGFIFEGILFIETGTGKVKCGVCQVECSRLIVHMNGNDYCTEYFSSMDEFKLEYSKYRDKESKRKASARRRSEVENPDVRNLEVNSTKTPCQASEDENTKSSQNQQQDMDISEGFVPSSGLDLA